MNDEFIRLFGSRPVEPMSRDEDPRFWAEVADWERMRAEFYQDVQ